MQVKKNVTKEVAKRYQKVRKKEKGRILDELVALTGYYRTYASWLLRNFGRKIVLSGREGRRFIRGQRKTQEEV
ncbi:MAG: hypothetical protein DDT40_00516 [candidate division WS2 bacterium]|uniref:Uncharacterized protein n=1 Tax=Psychracetigena formicireducens TaxID=2986056 RepID=A0A9E2BGS7_PSYF1|nr:hypothetical protein [Candidatus Psychracetigena formicireducens]MBT9145283.1 hypothetical protein [Candidatus Psychracetigena formicireducens]MBT9150346.1 hypothetical protein [Candidatus Psychracetigena formicireducens]